MEQLLADLHADFDRANATDITGWSDQQVRDHLIGLEALRSKLDALTLSVTAQFDTRRLASVDEAASTKAWLRCHPDLQLAAERAARQVRLARKLSTLPHAAAALAEGRINVEVVAKLASVDNPRTHDRLRDDEEQLVNRAAEERFDRFCRRIERWRIANDPDGAKPRSGARRLHLNPTFDDCWAMDGWFERLTRCQVDHIIPDSAGGPTSIDNGRCYCGFHNRARNKQPPDDDPDDADDDQA